MHEVPRQRKVDANTSIPFARMREVRARASQSLTASELFCPNCKASMPVRERLLLVLPDGELHEYLCVKCGSSLGERTTRQERQAKIILPP